MPKKSQPRRASKKTRPRFAFKKTRPRIASKKTRPIFGSPKFLNIVRESLELFFAALYERGTEEVIVKADHDNWKEGLGPLLNETYNKNYTLTWKTFNSILNFQRAVLKAHEIWKEKNPKTYLSKTEKGKGGETFSNYCIYHRYLKLKEEYLISILI